ncbi:hypothetical protein Tco_1050234, partial [Tanacetum coccineum]
MQTRSSSKFVGEPSTNPTSTNPKRRNRRRSKQRVKPFSLVETPVGDLLLLEKLLNDDPSSPLPPKEFHFEDIKMIKSSIDDPPDLELNDLPSHLEYMFLEGTDKLPVIIS